MTTVNKDTTRYCYIDLDIDNIRHKIARAAAFVDACDTRYGLSSNDLRQLGGSELSRLHDLIESDHDWSGETIAVKPPMGQRIVVKLDWETAPMACENFATLCSLQKAKIGDSGKPLTYQGCNVHRIVPGFVLQTGDFVFGNGSGGESIYGGSNKKFKDERAGLQKKHNKRGLLSMGNSGKNSNTSQFFFTLAPAPQCDGKHVVFGQVLSTLPMTSGDVVLAQAEQYGTTSGEPSVKVTITDCGLWEPFMVPGAGYWYDQPDSTVYGGISPTFMVQIRIAVVAPTEAVLDRFRASCRAAIITPVIVKDSQEASQVISQFLSEFAVDVIVAAPACSDVVDSIEQLPESWQVASDNIELSQVIFITKPVSAWNMIKDQSWICKTAWQISEMS